MDMPDPSIAERRIQRFRRVAHTGAHKDWETLPAIPDRPQDCYQQGANLVFAHSPNFANAALHYRANTRFAPTLSDCQLPRHIGV